MPKTPMRFLFLTLAIVLGAPSALAEDFTGFYAGVNAGYAHGREKDGYVSTPPSSRDPAADASKGLPPSALNASQALQAGRGSNGQAASRR